MWNIRLKISGINENSLNVEHAMDIITGRSSLEKKTNK